MDGRQAGTREGTGQMLVPVEAGANRVQISFVRTWDRTVGGWISLLAVIFVGGAGIVPAVGAGRQHHSRRDGGATRNGAPLNS